MALKNKKTKHPVKKHTNDILLVIWILKKIGWSDRRITSLKLPKSHHSISNYYVKACEKITSGELPIIDYRYKNFKIFSQNEKKLDYLNALYNSNPCGGGRKVNTKHYDK